MTTVTNIYEDGSNQIEHCDPCELPQAMAELANPSYSLLKHVIIESRHAADDPDTLELMRAQLEAQGALAVFEVAQKCIRCSEGLCLLANGNRTSWQVGGSLAIE